ncbi:TPA: hypothetical protein U2R10_000633 [Proteus mirabilis]|uniref:hypothetical protein n=1 Tax=Proteus TaxID=583 RepID=UPI00061D0571|nr:MULTISPECIES: hypothetical protein [Proteus]ARA23069.1 hypothetical protein AM438_11460 [Proteus mirabilis]ARX10483.1 hypothetical protein AM405_17020 [Proteus mirabilis]EGT3586756.1 hypothetical protein [Proteus mirabilis]EIM6939451.1 hypothetical protein [Proteus mirabilis]EIO2233552.1 hypothetical protein [Proteus mirabilis]
MKTSELIKKLQEIDKTVPFDADIVTGDDWLPCGVENVYHAPPNTYIQFNSYDADEMWGDLQENNRRTSIVELSARVSEINDVVKMIESNPSITALDIIKELNSRSKRMSEMANLLKKTE